MTAPLPSADFFKTDCRHFRPDRPCAPHKSRGVTCRDCSLYDPARPRVLILKLGALGDVLRSTCLLPALKEKHPRARVTWVTRENAFPVFEGLSEVDRLLPYSWETAGLLRQESFEELWSLDFEPSAACWVPDIRAEKKRGFAYNDGLLTALNPEAQGWVDMSLNDRLKRENRRTYQDWMFRICGLSGAERCEPLWKVSPEERAWARAAAARWRLPDRNRRLGINTGAGGRWEQKRWTEEGLGALLRLLKKEKGVSVLLLGGPEERALNGRLKKRFPGVIHAGCDNPLRRFGALVDLCDVVLTADTMALHLAVALKKRVVALFGATSAAEIELYGRGQKIHKDWDCLPCYRPRCVRSPHCMEALSADDVFAALKEQLNQTAKNQTR